MRLVLIASLLAALSAPAFAQAAVADSTAAADLERREKRATFYSLLVPGTGHLYVGETGRGLALLGLGVGLPVTAALATGVSSVGCNSRSGCDDIDGAAAVFLGAALVGTAAWVYGWIDADNAVRRVASDNVQLAPTVTSSAAGLSPGLSLRLDL